MSPRSRTSSAAGDYERRRREREREAERAQKAALAAQRSADRDAKRQYVADRADDAENRTHALNDRVEELRTLLARGLRRRRTVDPNRLRRQAAHVPLDLAGFDRPEPQPNWTDFEPPAPSAFGRLFGGDARYRERLADAREQFAQAQSDQGIKETRRQRRVAQARRDHAALLASEQRAVEQHNLSVDSFVAALRARDQAAVTRYLGMALNAVPLPSYFPKTAEATYSPHGEQAVIQVELPGPAVVPTTRAVQYVQSRDEYRELPRPAKESSELYRLVISQIALLCLHDIFAADSKIESVAFNGHVWATNPATGQREYPCLISLRVDRASFSELVLKDVKPDVCMRHLRALVSVHPYDLVAIKPIVDFDLSKYRFIEGLDAVSTLDSRPDLMDLTPDEFEHLVRQIFEATGLEGWTTAHSKDDGVDAVMVNKTPGGAMLCIVQAKRYSKVVGVSHIRELAGAMEEKRAGHGILVTTSWFTSGCWQKAREHGRMELFDGPRLKSMIKDHLGKDVLIGVDRPNGASTGPDATP
jgi:restriction system protein